MMLLLHGMSLLLAHRDILRCRTNSVAIGAKQTLLFVASRRRVYGYTPYTTSRSYIERVIPC